MYEVGEDLTWKRRSDARTLAEAEEIKADKQRFANAKIGAKEILEEKQKELAGISKIVKSDKKSNRFDTPKRNSNQATIAGFPRF